MLINHLPILGPANVTAAIWLSVENRGVLQLLFAYLMLAGAGMLMVSGTFLVLSKIREQYAERFTSLVYILLTGLLSGASGAVLTGMAFYMSRNLLPGLTSVHWINFSLLGGALLFASALFYEILCLNRERQSSGRRIASQDAELRYAEMNSLRNELDPHFVYNTLMPLYYLIRNDVKKAEQFTHKLMQVYQYSLVNRQNDFVNLDEELQFAAHYLFLLQIRYPEQVVLTVDVPEERRNAQVLPFSLQILLENAIKHNGFDAEHPLQIRIATEGNKLVVRNNTRRPQGASTSCKVGLENLRSRYALLCDRSIAVNRTREEFVVKLPLLKNNQTYAVHHNYRG
jgi:sensor histidine kinase YesM